MAERAIKEERRRTKAVGHFFDEKGCLKLCYSSLIRASQRWQRVGINEFDRTRLRLLREQLHQEYLERTGKSRVGIENSKMKPLVTAA